MEFGVALRALIEKLQAQTSLSPEDREKTEFLRREAFTKMKQKFGAGADGGIPFYNLALNGTHYLAAHQTTKAGSHEVLEVNYRLVGNTTDTDSLRHSFDAAAKLNIKLTPVDLGHGLVRVAQEPDVRSVLSNSANALGATRMPDGAGALYVLSDLEKAEHFRLLDLAKQRELAPEHRTLHDISANGVVFRAITRGENTFYYTSFVKGDEAARVRVSDVIETFKMQGLVVRKEHENAVYGIITVADMGTILERNSYGRDVHARVPTFNLDADRAIIRAPARAPS